MELKQFAESLSLVVYKKKKSNKNQHGDDFNNRPSLWQERFKPEKGKSKAKKQTVINNNISLKHQYLNEFWKVNKNYSYCVTFDPSLILGEIWIDHETMNFFNSQRDNIYISSSNYDVLMLKSMRTNFIDSSQEKVNRKRKSMKNKSKENKKGSPNKNSF